MNLAIVLTVFLVGTAFAALVVRFFDRANPAKPYREVYHLDDEAEMIELSERLQIDYDRMMELLTKEEISDEA